MIFTTGFSTTENRSIRLKTTNNCEVLHAYLLQLSLEEHIPSAYAHDGKLRHDLR
jgi:hypothetical protein